MWIEERDLALKKTLDSNTRWQKNPEILVD